MKAAVLFIFCFLSSTIWAQHLNFAGHLINKTEASKIVSTGFGNNFNAPITLQIKGSTKFRTHFGYITLTPYEDNVYCIVRFYDAKGILIKQTSFRQTINFLLSPDRKFAAFHDSRNIQLIDLEKCSSTAIEGSNVFAFSENNSFVYYNEKKNTIHFDQSEYRVNELVTRLLFYQGKLIILLRSEIEIIEGNSLRALFTKSPETIFDADVMNNKLYISTKKVFEDHFEFNSYFSNDLQNFTSDEKIIFPLKHATSQYNNLNRNVRLSNTLPGEQIRDPLGYYQDTVYQAVGNSYDEIQDYSSGTSIYPHPGVDLFGVFMQDVVSVKTGFVKAILTTSAEFHWRIAISNENIPDSSTGYLYAHVEETSIPYVVGDSVAEGDVIGQLVDFPVTGFVHCHFARVYDEGTTWSGGWWTYDNPLSYMTNFFDSIPPVFEKTITNDAFAFRDSSNIYLSPDSLFGNVKVITKVYDQVNTFWHVDVNKLRYSLSPLSSPQTMLLDTFAYEFNFYNDFYNAGPYIGQLLHTIYSFDSTCYTIGNYDDRNFYHIITNSDGNDTIDNSDSLQFFDTRLFADGDYIFRVTASDPSGNTTNDSMLIRIRNLSSSIFNSAEFSEIEIIPNPFNDFVTLKKKNESQQLTNLSIKNISGQNVFLKSQLMQSDDRIIVLDLRELPSGLYIISFEINGKLITKKIIRS